MPPCPPPAIPNQPPPTSTSAIAASSTTSSSSPGPRPCAAPSRPRLLAGECVRVLAVLEDDGRSGLVAGEGVLGTGERWVEEDQGYRLALPRPPAHCALPLAGVER